LRSVSNEIFGTDIAQMVNDTFAGNLIPLTLTKVTEGGTDEYGNPTTTTADHAGEGVRSNWKATVAVARGYPLEAVKIIVLQNGTTPEPTLIDKITIMSNTYRIIDIQKDPVDATWTLAAVKV
jgi:hypothetical protein